MEVESIIYCEECDSPTRKAKYIPGQKVNWIDVECDCEYNFRRQHGSYLCKKCGANEVKRESHSENCAFKDTY